MFSMINQELKTRVWLHSTFHSQKMRVRALKIDKTFKVNYYNHFLLQRFIDSRSWAKKGCADAFSLFPPGLANEASRKLSAL